MFATEDKKDHAKVCLTLIFKAMQLKLWISRSVNRWSHVIHSNMCHILDLENVEIDNKIKFSIMFATGDKKGHAKGCLTLIFKVIQLR